MSEIVNGPLQKIAKGTGIVLVGTLTAALLGFCSRILIARFLDQSEYGIYSLALVVLNIAVVFSTLGLQQGSTRQIAYFRGMADNTKARLVITSSIQMALLVSILISISLFFAAGTVSVIFFEDGELSIPLKILSIAIPFYVLMYMFVAIFRGFGEVKPQLYFMKVLRGTLFLLLLIPVILLSSGLSAVICAFSASTIIVCLAFTVYTIKKLPVSIEKGSLLTINSVNKELLLFSLPLLGALTLHMVMHWTDTLMLGYFKTSDIVGLYNVALPLANLIPITLTSMSFIYLPVISQLYSKGHMEEIKRSYQVLTKWIFSVSFPVFLILFLFPETVLSFCFGSQYAEAAPALRILSLGFVFHAFLGANGMTLLVLGKTTFLMWASLLVAVLNIILNLVLIPEWGMIGAAVASLISYLSMNIFISAQLFRISKIHPFTKSYLKPILAAGVIILIIYLLTRDLIVVSYWMLPIVFLLFLAIYVLSLLLTKSFDKEDIMLLLAVEKRAGINMEPLKKIIRRFM